MDNPLPDMLPQPHRHRPEQALRVLEV